MSFLDLIRPSSKKTTNFLPSKTSKADEERIVKILGLRHLESMPAQAAKAFQLSCNPKATLEDFVVIVESDEVLSARILRIANSVYFRRGDQAKDISSAVNNIGLNEIKCLLSAAMLKSLLRARSKYRPYLWANSIATGIGARILSNNTNIPAGEAFLCGILHDVGKLIFLERLPKEYEGVLNQSYNSEDSIITLEERAFDINHVEVGKWLAEKWAFPEVVRSAIFYHHDLWPKDTSLRGKATNHAQLVKCADVLSHALRLGHPTSMSYLGTVMRREQENVATQLNQSVEMIESLASQIQVQFDNEFSLYNAE